MTFRLMMTRKDPLQTDFVVAGERAPLYTSDTSHYSRPLNRCRAITTVTRKDSSGDRFQVGVIEWPFHSNESPRLVVGTRAVEMIKMGLYTSADRDIRGPERFTAVDGYMYGWQLHDSRPQLVPLWANHPLAYVATFVQTKSGFFLMRKHTSSLFIPPEATHILDDIVVTFIYFEAKWREKLGSRSRNSWSGSLM